MTSQPDVLDDIMQFLEGQNAVVGDGMVKEAHHVNCAGDTHIARQRGIKGHVCGPSIPCPLKVLRRFEAAAPSLSERSCLRTSWAALRESGCSTFSCFCEDGLDALTVLVGAIDVEIEVVVVERRESPTESGLNMSRREGDQQQQRANSAQQTLDSELVVVVVVADAVHANLSSVLYDISRLLNTQLDKETLATCVGMIESGVNPEALAVSPCRVLLAVDHADDESGGRPGTQTGKCSAPALRIFLSCLVLAVAHDDDDRRRCAVE